MKAEEIFKDLYNNIHENCPDIETICASIDRTIPMDKNISDHLLNCDRCFNEYMTICQQMEHMEEVRIPAGLKEMAIGKQKNSGFNFENIIIYIREKWSWLSWSSGFAFGAAMAIILFIFIPLGLKENIYFSLNKSAQMPTPSISYVSTGKTDRFSAEFHFKRGEEFVRASSMSKAKEEFIQSIKYDPDYAEAHWNLGLIYEKEGNYSESIKYLKRYISLTPSIGSYEEANKRIEKLTKLIH